ncbi:MAG: tripartite tricarboxylate transporter substrate binding protein [Burkholderiales bacterium]|nr:tripartite tricarboxylate transporter substrate binding protein [Burkholderiales bacterium]
MRYSFVILLAAFAAIPVQSQQYPVRPVRMIVPFAPGGAVDVVARIAAVGMTDTLGQQVVVDNRAGGGGVIGTDITVQARGDGYTLLLHSAAIASEPALRAKLPYDAMKDLAPVTLVGVTPNLLVAHPLFAAKSARDLIALAKEKPGIITYGTGGVGSSSHLAVELFGILSGTRFNHIPFKGAGPAVTAVVAGELNFTIAPMPAAISHTRAGRLRALGVSGLKRSPAAADIPTIAETGLPGYEFVAWFGLLAPASTPPKLVERIASQVQAAVNAPDTRGKMESQGFEPETNSPAEFRAHILKETEKWRKVITQAGIKAS